MRGEHRRQETMFSYVAPEARVPEAYIETFRRLVQAGIPTVALRDVPWMGHDVPSCVFSPGYLSDRSCNRPRSEVRKDGTLSSHLMRLPEEVAYIDMTDKICDARIRHAVRDGLLVYRDEHHLTATCARHIGPVLAERITSSRKNH